MELLANNICHEPPIRHKGTFQLTPCLQALCREQNTHGLVIKGKRYDIGSSPQGYVDTVYSFHQSVDHEEEVSRDMQSAISPVSAAYPRWFYPGTLVQETVREVDDDTMATLSIIDSLLDGLQ